MIKLIISCVVALMLTISPCGAIGDPLYGNWRVKSILDSAPITAINDVQANALIGRSLIFGVASVRLGQDVCLEPEFSESKEDTFDAFYNGYRTDPVNLHLPENVVAVRVECKNKSEISIFYIANKNRIVFYWLGFFFEAVRVKS